jgi:hypothetical protein
LLDRSRNNTKVKANVILFYLTGLRFSRFFFKSSRFVFNWKQKKASSKYLCSSYCQLWSRVHTKIKIFENSPNFLIFLCNCPEILFRKLIQNPNKQNQKRITHSHRSNPELWSWVHTKKHFQFSPNFFNLVFPDFSPNLPDFFSIENIQLSYFHPWAYRTKKKKWNMSFLSSVMIENAYKNYNFYSLPEFFEFPL